MKNLKEVVEKERRQKCALVKKITKLMTDKDDQKEQIHMKNQEVQAEIIKPNDTKSQFRRTTTRQAIVAKRRQEKTT
jgi:hypothetical protein